MSRTLIVLLRGVTPTGTNRVPMAEWRDALERAGFDDAQTVIASGNAVVGSHLTPRAAEARIRQLIRDEIGPDLIVFARSTRDVRAFVDAWPYEAEHPTGRAIFTTFSEPPSNDAVAALRDREFPDVEWAIDGDRMWTAYHGDISTSRFVNATLERVLGVRATSRTRGTMLKLLSIAEAR